MLRIDQESEMEADIYVGLDASLDETSLCIVNQAGKAERETKVATDPDAIRSALESWKDRIARMESRHPRSASG